MRSSLNVNPSFNCLTLSLWGYWKVRCCQPPRVPLKALILSPLSVGLTCMVMRGDHQWLTPGPTANCIGDAHTHNQVLLRIPDCQVGPGPFHYQFTLQPRKAPIPPESEEKASNWGRWAEKGLGGNMGAQGHCSAITFLLLQAAGASPEHKQGSIPGMQRWGMGGNRAVDKKALSVPSP